MLMVTPFSQRVAEPTWFDTAVAWIVEQVEERGHHVTGTVEQRRIRPWSTQLVVPTDAGRLWFKTNCRAMSFEPALQAVLSDLVPAAVDRPFAVDADRGWLLTRDHGPTLREVRDPTPEDWQDVVAEAAAMQAALAPHGETLSAAGLPDCSPATTLDRFDRLLALYTDLPDRHPAHVPPELADRLRSARPRLVSAVERLVTSASPNTWQHGDLHPGNVYGAGDRMRVFDFGDSQWAHPLETLAVPYGWITKLSQTPWPPVLAAWSDVWGVDPASLDEDWRASSLTHAVNRSMLWWGCLEEATAEEWRQWGDGPVSHLCRMLEP